PCYNEEESLHILYEELCKLTAGLNTYRWEILFVNDGSKDKTLSIIKEFQANDCRIAYVDLSRNFGKENAMLAGFDYVKGDCVIILDADLQDPPSLIPVMIQHWEEGFDDVYAKREDRGKESKLRYLLSVFFYRILFRMSHIEIPQNVGDFRLLDRKCIDSLMQLRESQRYTKGLFAFIGFRKKEITFKRNDREYG